MRTYTILGYSLYVYKLYKTNLYLRRNFCNSDNNEQTLLLCKTNANSLAIYVIVLKAVFQPEVSQLTFWSIRSCPFSKAE